MTPTLSTVDGRSVLRVERRLRRPPDEVWPALVEPDRLAAWFPSGATIEPRVGGTVTFGFGGDGTVTDLDPPRLIAFTWETDHLRFELSPDGDGSLLVLVHTFDDRAGAASFAAGWESCLDVLDGAPEGGDHESRHEQLLVELGLLEPQVAPDGGEVRLERQLLHPADRVWPALLALTADAPVRETREPELREVDLPAGRERWELREGTGHGARLVLVRTGPGTPPAAVTARVEELLAALR